MNLAFTFRDIGQKMYCNYFPACDIINFEIIFRTRRAFNVKKSIFHHFKKDITEANETLFFSKRESNFNIPVYNDLDPIIGKIMAT